MNLLFYTDTPNYGGAEKQMNLLAGRLRKMGHSVSLACGAYSVLERRREEMETYYDHVYFLPTIHKHDPRHYTQLKKLVKDGQFDLLHVHLWNPGSCRYAFWAAKSMNVPVVATEHDPFELNGIKKLVKQMCLRRTDQIIVVNSDDFRQLVEDDEVLKDRLNLVHNGIELDSFLENHDKLSLPVKDGDSVITCVAELHERKGQKHLIEAFRKLNAEMPSLHLVLAGTGPAEKVLKKRCGNIKNLYFLGWCDKIPQLLKASDVFVLPSLREAFGLVIVEAMASGVVVVATDTRGAKDIIEDGKTGYLVPPGNSEKLAEAIRTVLRNPDQKRDIEKAARERAIQHFSAKVMAEKTLLVYEKTMKSRWGDSSLRYASF